MAMLMTNMSISLADDDVDQFCYVGDLKCACQALIVSNGACDNVVMQAFNPLYFEKCLCWSD